MGYKCLRFDMFSEARFSYIQQLKQQGLCADDFENIKNNQAFRHSLTCPRDDARHNNLECVTNTCDHCSNLQKMGLMQLHLVLGATAPLIKYSKWVVVEYMRKDGTVKKKKILRFALFLWQIFWRTG